MQIDPLIPKSDQHLISLHNITPESHPKVMRIKEMITTQRSSWLFDSPCQHHKKCVKNSKENMHTDVRVQRAIASIFFFIFETWLYILMLSYPKIFQSSLQVMLFLLKKIPVHYPVNRKWEYSNLSGRNWCLDLKPNSHN